MTQHPTSAPLQDDQPQPAGAEQPASADPFADFAAAPAPQAAPSPNDLADALAKAEGEKAELKDKLLRTLADMENMRRRTEKEVADARAYGATNFARDVLTVADNIRRALDSVAGDPATGVEGPLKTVLDGIELTERDLIKTLERHGVKRIDPKGQKFDPNLHQAMFEAQNPDMPNGHVMEVVQVGYTIGERVLRPALVGVARGGPKADATGAATPPPAA